MKKSSFKYYFNFLLCSSYKIRNRKKKKTSYFMIIFFFENNYFSLVVVVSVLKLIIIQKAITELKYIFFSLIYGCI